MENSLRPCEPRYENFGSYTQPARADSSQLPALLAASQETLDKLAIVHRMLRSVDQVPIHTDHVLHGGMYARTIRLEVGIVMLGALIKRATILIVNGPASVLVGDEWGELDGYNVFPGCAGRKQLFVTRGDVAMTMIFPTAAKTVEEAEAEFTDEADLLISRRMDNGDTITITGE
jgi:hypothetical protein